MSVPGCRSGSRSEIVPSADTSAAMPGKFSSIVVPACVAQALEVLRRFGPLALEPAPELEVLVTSLARHWPTVDVPRLSAP
jgi:hypothetical protein